MLFSLAKFPFKDNAILSKILSAYCDVSMIFQADVNKDGFVDKQEFMDLIKKKCVHLSDQQEETVKEYLKVTNLF